MIVDAPPSCASKIRTAVAEVTSNPITHLIYSHYQADPIGGATTPGGSPTVIADAATHLLLRRDSDPNWPLATVTFTDKYHLTIGSPTLRTVVWRGRARVGNIYVHAPKQRTYWWLM